MKKVKSWESGSFGDGLLSPFYHLIRAMSALYLFPTRHAKCIDRNHKTALIALTSLPPSPLNRLKFGLKGIFNLGFSKGAMVLVR